MSGQEHCCYLLSFALVKSAFLRRRLFSLCKAISLMLFSSCFSLFSRAYLDVKELKEILHLDGSTHLNVFFANSSDEDLAGVATWPWDKEALTHLGRRQINTHAYMHACVHAHVRTSLLWQPRLLILSNYSSSLKQFLSSSQL